MIIPINWMDGCVQSTPWYYSNITVGVDIGGMEDFCKEYLKSAAHEITYRQKQKWFTTGKGVNWRNVMSSDEMGSGMYRRQNWTRNLILNFSI